MPNMGDHICAAGENCQNGSCACDTDYINEGNGCIHTKLVECNDQSPANASAEASMVEITYTTADGWSSPADCQWSCDPGHTEVSGACVCSPESCIDGPCDLVSQSCQPTSPYPDPPYGGQVDDIMEDLVLPEADGLDVSLSDYYSLYHSVDYPKVIVVSFLEKNCGPSQASASMMQEIHESHYIASGYNEMTHISILTGFPPNSDCPTLQDAVNWKLTFNLTTPVTSDTNCSVVDPYDVSVTPTFFVIDPSTMRIVEKIEGLLPESDFENILAPIIANN